MWSLLLTEVGPLLGLLSGAQTPQVQHHASPCATQGTLGEGKDAAQGSCWPRSLGAASPAGPEPLTIECTMNSQVLVRSLASSDRFMSQRRVY